MTTADVPTRRARVLIYRDVVDKSEWGPGPWQIEPDKVQWTDPSTRLACLALRHPYNGNWCGYVGITIQHPLYGLPWTDGAFDHLEAHRGINYTDACLTGPEASTICHVPEPGTPEDLWWVGFDCARRMDRQPAAEARLHRLLPQLRREDLIYAGSGEYHKRRPGLASEAPDVYRTLLYVRDECKRLAGQLAREGPP